MTLITPFPILYDFSRSRNNNLVAREQEGYLHAQVDGLCATAEALDRHGFHVNKSEFFRWYVKSGASDIARGLYDVFIGTATMLGQEERAVAWVEKFDGRLQSYLRKRVDTPRSGSNSQA